MQPTGTKWTEEKTLIGGKLSKRLKLTDRWYIPKSESLLEKEIHKILLDYDI